MNFKNLLKVKKYARVFSLTKYFFSLERSFILFRVNMFNVNVKFYVKQFFLKYCFKMFYVSKRSYFTCSFKNYNFLLIEFKNFEYITFFLNFDFDYFDPQDSSLIFVALKIKKNFLFYSFLKQFELDDNNDYVDFFIFYLYFFLIIKNFFLIKVNLLINYVFVLNKLVICQQFIKLPLN